MGIYCVFFFFKQKTAYEVYQCDWSSDVCSSDLGEIVRVKIMKASALTLFGKQTMGLS